jgi:hypothetical protein
MFHFSIREILLITLMVAFACGWLLEHQTARHTAGQLKQVRADLAKTKHELTTEIRRLQRVNEITAAQWSKALSQLPPNRP